MSEIGRLAILGVGLIGGSLARALRAAGAVDTIVGCGRGRANLERAQALGVVDEWHTDPGDAVRGADTVLLSMPVGATEAVLRALAPELEPEAVITDAGSTKGSVVAAAERVFGGVPARFVPGHPVAGTEHSGVDASFAGLFHDRRVILTPLAHTDADALERVRRLWRTAGAHVEEMDVARHDRVLAATSHLPHVLAYALVDQLAAMEADQAVFRYAAGGFRDFTRIASSSPVMWRDIVLANRDALLPLLNAYGERLDALRAALEAGDGDTLAATFTRAKRARDDFRELMDTVASDDPGAE